MHKLGVPAPGRVSPNAIVFSGWYVTIPRMARAGLVPNFVFTAIIAGPGSWLVLQVFR